MAAGVALVAIVGVLHTTWGQDRIRKAAVAAIRDELGLIATLKRVRVHLVPLPSVEAEGILLDDPVYGRFAKARKLVLRPSVWHLTQGRFFLDRIELSEPEIRLVIRDGQIRNLPRTDAGGDPESSLPFSSIEVTQASVQVDAEPFGHALLGELDGQLTVIGDNELDIRAKAGHGGIDHPLGREPITSVQAKFYVDPRKGIDVERFAIRTPYLRALVRDGFLPIPVTHRYSGTAELSVALHHLDRLPHGWNLPPIDGHLRIEASLEGKTGGPVGTARLSIKKGVVDGRGVGDVEAELDIRKEAISIKRARLNVVDGGGYATLSGTLGRRPDLPLRTRIQIKGLRFAKLMKQLGVTPNAIVQWHINATSQLNGTLSPLRLGGPISLQSDHFLVTQGPWHERTAKRIVGVERSRVKGRVRLHARALRFENLVAHTPRSRLLGDVHLGFDNQLRVAVSGEIDLRDASPLLQFPLGGRGIATVEVDGTFSDPAVAGYLNFDSFAFNTYVLGDIEGPYRLEEGGQAARFASLTATKRESPYQVQDLFLDFRNGRFSVDGHVSTDRMLARDFYHVFHLENDQRFIDYQALLSGTADIRFTHGFPDDSPNGTLHTTVDAGIADAEINGFAFEGGRFRGQWRWLNHEEGIEGSEIQVDNLHLRKGAGTVTVSGHIKRGGYLRMNVAADRIALRDTEGIRDRLPSLGGTVGVVGDVRGTVAVPRIDLDLQMSGLSWRNRLLGDGRVYVRLTDRSDPWIQAARSWPPGDAPEDQPCAEARAGFYHGRWRPDPPLTTIDGPRPRLDTPMAYVVCGSALDGQLRTDLAVGRTELYPLRGRLDATGLALDPLLAQVAETAEMSGLISGHLFLEDGDLQQPDSLTGKLQLTRLEAGREDVRLQNDGPIDIRFDRGRVELERVALTGLGSTLTLNGHRSRRGGLAVGVRGGLDLALMGELLPAFGVARGRVEVQATVAGRIEAPTIYGKASLRGASVADARLPAPITDLEGDVSFSARRVTFEGFHARFAGGRIALAGTASLRGRGIERYQFDIDGQGLTLSPEPGVNTILNGRARLAWRDGGNLPRLSGTLELARLRYGRDIGLLENLSFDTLARGAPAEVEQYDPEKDRLELDLQIVHEEPLRVTNNLIDAEIRIEDSDHPFVITGTDQRFGATGTLSVDRGLVRFRNTEFTIQRGAIEFNDPNRLNPQFDVLAETEIRRSGALSGPQWRVSLHAFGSRDSFQLNTSSEPELSQQDIALLLTVGMTRAEADQLQAGNVGGTIALEALTAVTGLDREVRRALPLIDDFSIGSRYSTATGRTVPQVSIGKRITDRVRLSASSGLGDAQEVISNLELRLDEQTSVQAAYDNINTTTASSVGNVGLDVRWRLEFE